MPERKTIYLGGCRYSEQTTTELKRVVEKLIYCRDNDETPDKKTLVWLEAASPEIQEKLVKVQLIQVPQKHTLGELWDSFLAQRTGLKKATIEIDESTKSWFFEFFDENEMLEKVTQDTDGEVENFTLETTYESEHCHVLETGKGLFQLGRETRVDYQVPVGRDRDWIVCQQIQ